MATMTPNEFWESCRDAKQARVDAAINGGFEFNDWRHRQPTMWFDQMFCHDMVLAPGVVIPAEHALRVGSTLSRLAVGIIANGRNTTDLIVPPSAQFTCTVEGCDTEDGTFERVYTATVEETPTGGFSAGPSAIIARFELPESLPKWIKVSVSASDTTAVSGTGTVDVILLSNAQR